MNSSLLEKVEYKKRSTGAYDELAADVLTRAKVVAAVCAEMAAESDYEGAFPVKEFAAMHDAGLLAATLPRTQGGAGIGSEPSTSLGLLHLLKIIGSGNLAVGRIYEGHVNALQLINTFADHNQIKRFAEDALAGKIFGVWNTQAADGVRLHALGRGSYRLEGAKTFASGAGSVTRPIVTGRLPDEEGGGWQMFIVPMDEVEVNIDSSWWQPLGMRASASFHVDFGGVRLGADDLLGAPDDYYRQPWFTAGAIRFAAVQLGAAETLFNLTRDYLRGLGRESDSHQQTRAGETAILVESGNNWLRGAAQQLDTLLSNSTEVEFVESTANSEYVERLLAYANMTRTAIETICIECMRLCERSVGARGLLRPHAMERIHRDLTLYLRQPAPDASLAHVGRYALEQQSPVDTLWFYDEENEA